MAWIVDDVMMADLKKLEEDAVSFAQQAISLDEQGLCEVAFFYYCVSMIIVALFYYQAVASNATFFFVGRSSLLTLLCDAC